MKLLAPNPWSLLEWPSEKELLPLAERFGSPVSVRRSDAVASLLRPTTKSEASPRSLSALHGTGAFPFHTDCAHHRIPPRFTLLRLAHRSESDRPTLLLPLKELALNEAEAARLRNTVWLVNGGRVDAFASPDRILISRLSDPEAGTGVEALFEVTFRDVEETVLFDVERSDPSARVMFFFAGIPDDQAVVVEGDENPVQFEVSRQDLGG